MPRIKKIALLNLFGTLLETHSGEPMPVAYHDQRLIDGVWDAVPTMVNAGWTIYGITDQGDCPHIVPISEVLKEQTQTLRLLPWMKKAFAAPSGGKTCLCIELRMSQVLDSSNLSALPESLRRKVDLFSQPNPGMHLLALQDAQYRPDRDKVVVVGSTDTEYQGAESAGLDFMDAKFWRDKWNRKARNNETHRRLLSALSK